MGLQFLQFNSFSLCTLKYAKVTHNGWEEARRKKLGVSY